MTKSTKYVQCVLRRRVSDGVVWTTSYLPGSFAKVGQCVKLKDNGQWVDGWIVTMCASSYVSQEKLPDYRKAVRTHRTTSGDSLPRLLKQDSIVGR